MFITAVRSFKLKAAPANGKRHTPSCSIAQHVLSLRDPIHTQLGIEMISGLFNMFANEMDFLTLTLWTGSRRYNDFQFSYTINMVYSITKKKRKCQLTWYISSQMLASEFEEKFCQRHKRILTHCWPLEGPHISPDLSVTKPKACHF